MSQNDVPKLAEIVGRTVARHRIARNLTQDEVAEQLGIGNEAVSRIERGVVMPTISRLVELATIFGCSASELLTEASNRPGDQARHLERLISRLNNQDRELVMDIVESLASKLEGRQK